MAPNTAPAALTLTGLNIGCHLAGLERHGRLRQLFQPAQEDYPCNSVFLPFKHPNLESLFDAHAVVRQITSFGVRKVDPSRHKSSLEPSTSSAEKQEEDHDQQNDAQAAATVIANAGSHVVTAAAKDE
jgi:hypothetical protein